MKTFDTNPKKKGQHRMDSLSRNRFSIDLSRFNRCSRKINACFVLVKSQKDWQKKNEFIFYDNVIVRLLRFFFFFFCYSHFYGNPINPNILFHFNFNFISDVLNFICLSKSFLLTGATELIMNNCDRFTHRFFKWSHFQFVLFLEIKPKVLPETI